MTVSGYYWIREIARGGMGRVDLILRSEGAFQRRCAVKRLHGVLRDDPECRAMFLDEARVAGWLEHPHLIRVFDVGEDTEGPYLMMDFVDGLTVRDLIRHALQTNTPIPLEVAVELVRQASEGLHFAHELRSPQGALLELVHRDVSPQNIMVGHDGIVRVMDFGIARSLGRTSRTSTGVLKGKLGYMSPEQLRFRSPDRRSDLFALGVVLYELLTSRRLYANADGEGPRRILEEPPPDIGVDREGLPPSLVELVFQMLAKNPAKRPGSALEVAERLRDIRDDAFLLDDEALGLKRFMSQAFASKADERSAEWASVLGRLERGELPPWPRPIAETGKGAAPKTRALSRWWVGGALVGVVAAALSVGVYIGRSPASGAEEPEVRPILEADEAVAATPPELAIEAAPIEAARIEAAPQAPEPPSPTVAGPPSQDSSSEDASSEDASSEDASSEAEAPGRSGARRRRRARRASRREEHVDTASPRLRDPLAPAAFGSIGEPR